ncbi:hypothetical protein A3D66_00135 [Candidatus Kaiserbacteria bacterium RIFCSPHIGHO2_02_FULL_50_9]|uniref:Peptidase n=1 Tax=Candidatus Kaiserbacteria bacterium RIFCSPLOWO2_01_FULL_51_21 TaxID=1798508 RepID=A0A1F6ECZ3_9BACT|nr:MAG: hypothetical protein A2761_01980 [Candidatus Kaiserbacteria bacterium RIFCSPHIGHO2_01_FULL_51_33]OGG63492.1 MAG: hypothetical protein A3D66_00135 [Candidatus Kaiserbacteria bacterium RIFCSPHIGHO2_02_FULL_50_9]OGG71521.1 MAG: hypothetical protein A3A35_02185 [Candidatus Kaiserbacteria bacterium RIFCSPLOWO2_01_FULL_51_21]
MATKYILVGGYPTKTPDGGKAFAEELVKGFDEPVKILDCIFARPKDNWDKAYNEYREFFKAHLPGKKKEIILADPDTFAKQVTWADAIYLRGGETELLIAALNKNEEWRQKLDGKTLAGSSAGADAIAKYYYGLDSLQVHEGLGLLPVKVLVHYRSDYNAPNVDWNKAYSELNNYQEDLPLIALKEGEFKVIEK